MSVSKQTGQSSQSKRGGRSSNESKRGDRDSKDSNLDNISDRESDVKGEEEAGTEVLPATDVTIYNAYNMGPAFGKKFPVPYIIFILNQMTQERLANKVYSAEEAMKWTRDLADDINLKFKGSGSFPRFKHVVNVMLYQQTGAGCCYGARAIWDPLSDDYGKFTYDGGSFVCIISVFGCYQY
ncbi:dynein light chain Tctex-type [Drosophila kikkawai]|uniref:Dynein light chain Tctex-type n=1 Tax=Drosophila kikkawai TaxID=30033 RepID=A0A6P4JH33_DROKI|nr:dynein light chain Tctex-type [Drosophila kikkawai]KAH8351532.1 hypothetical protein KR059_006225 [Drosophila kikkawai]